MRKWFRAAPWGFAFAAVVAAGCGTIPDVKPFADATAELHRSMSSAGDAVSGEIRAVAARWPDDERKELLATEAALAKDWDERRAATAALLDYADSLAELAAAGRGGAESAKAVADGVNSLLQQVDRSGIGANAVEIAALVNGVVAEARALDSMAKAVRKVEPAVRRVAEILKADLAAATKPVALARGELKSALKEPFSTALKFRKALLDARGQLHKDFVAGDAAKQAALVARLDETDRLLAATSDWYDPLQRDMAAVDARVDADLALLARTSELVDAWAEAHAAVAASIETGRRLNVRKLVTLATDVRDLAEKGGRR